MSTLVELKYGYDRASNRLYRRDEAARSNSALFDELYDYDGLHRLTELDRGELNSGNTALDAGPSLTQDWTLDPLGNWNRFQQGVSGALDQTREHNPVNEIVDIDKTVGTLWPTPAYDNNGNTTTLPQPQALGDSYTGVYDAWNRLVKLTNDADSDKTVAEYQYDGLNRRAVKKVYNSGGTLDQTRHAYFSDQWQVLEERVDSSTDPERQFLWGRRYVDDLVLRDRDTTGNGTLDERLYALTDALFNVVAITDDTGVVKERFAYQPYGKSEPLNPDFTTYSGTDYEWEYRFTGRELDLESGLQINRNRYLHLELGRWLTRDPMEHLDSHLLYEYAVGDPVNYEDPLGTQAFRCQRWDREGVAEFADWFGSNCLSFATPACFDCAQCLTRFSWLGPQGAAAICAPSCGPCAVFAGQMIIRNGLPPDTIEDVCFEPVERDKIVICKCVGVSRKAEFVRPVPLPIVVGLPGDSYPVETGGAHLSFVNGWKCDDGSEFVTAVTDSKEGLANIGKEVRISIGKDTKWRIIPCTGNEKFWPGACPDGVR